MSAAWVVALTDFWMPTVEDPHVRARCRAGIETWLIAWPLAVLSVVVYAVLEQWISFGLNVFMVVLGPLMLWGLKRTGSMTPWIQLSLGAALVMYGPGTVLQPPFDDTALFFACVVPLVAGHTMGLRSGAWWALGTVAVVTVALLVAHRSSSPPLDDWLLASKAFNLVTTLGMVTLMAGRSEVAHHRDRAESRHYKEKLQGMVFDGAVVAERQRQRRGLAVDLHDGIGQSLALALLRLKDSQRTVNPQSAGSLGQGIEVIEGALVEARSLMFELSPPLLYDLGLPAALGWLSEQLEARHGVRVSVTTDAPFPRLDDELASLLFRMVRELLLNVVKHAAVTAASVKVRHEAGAVSVLVEDAGPGFDASLTARHDGGGGFGLFSVREQILSLGGTFEITSSPGKGTKVVLRVPLKVP